MWINKPKKKSKHNTNNTEKRKMRSRLYATTIWRKLRDGYLMTHPICELCGENFATDCHHIISPFNEEIKDKEYYMYNPNNIIGLCKRCHGRIHQEKKESSLYNIFFDRENNLK